MKEKTIEKLKKKLENKKKSLEEKLSSIASKDRKIQGDWDTNFPDFNKSFGNKVSEAGADEVEEYENIKPVEHNLELRLQQVNRALKKIEKGEYGLCQNCKKSINVLRLKILPETKNCLKCQKQKVE